MEALTNKNFRDLNQLIIDIAEKFFQARQSHRFLDEEYLLNSSSYLKKVQKAYSSLSESERNLINNEFFFQNYHLWWEGLYSKATFYRYKKEAMVSFLEAFYNE